MLLVIKYVTISYMKFPFIWKTPLFSAISLGFRNVNQKGLVKPFHLAL